MCPVSLRSTDILIKKLTPPLFPSKFSSKYATGREVRVKYERFNYRISDIFR